MGRWEGILLRVRFCSIGIVLPAGLGRWKASLRTWSRLDVWLQTSAAPLCASLHMLLTHVDGNARSQCMPAGGALPAAAWPPIVACQQIAEQMQRRFDQRQRLAKRLTQLWNNILIARSAQQIVCPLQAQSILFADHHAIVKSVLSCSRLTGVNSNGPARKRA